MFLSLPMLLELREALQHPKFAQRLAKQGETAGSLTERFRAGCHEAVPARFVPPPELRDPDDIHVLACAVAAEAGPGKTVAVVGDGAVGLLAVLAALPPGINELYCHPAMIDDEARRWRPETGWWWDRNGAATSAERPQDIRVRTRLRGSRRSYNISRRVALHEVRG
jgi:hypothetical protein